MLDDRALFTSLLHLCYSSTLLYTLHIYGHFCGIVIDSFILSLSILLFPVPTFVFHGSVLSGVIFFCIIDWRFALALAREYQFFEVRFPFYLVNLTIILLILVTAPTLVCRNS